LFFNILRRLYSKNSFAQIHHAQKSRNSEISTHSERCKRHRINMKTSTITRRFLFARRSDTHFLAFHPVRL